MQRIISSSKLTIVLSFFLTVVPLLGYGQENLHLEAGGMRLDFTGYGQATYTADNATGENTNAFEIKRVILMADAHITPKLQMYLMVDAASQDSKKILHEYWGAYKFSDAFNVKFGQHKMPFTMENPISPTAMGNIFFHDGVCYLVGIGGDPVYGNYVGRDFGLLLSGKLFKASDGHNYLNYFAGVYNGTGINQKENNNQKDIILRADFLPVKDLTLSVSTYLGTGHAIADDPYGCFKQDDDYSRNRFAAGFEARLKPFYLRSEYIRGWNERTPSQTVYAEMWIHLIKKYNIDLLLDYEYFDKNIFINDATRNYMTGLQWWFYKKCRISALYQYKDPVTGNNTNRFVTQLQLRF